MANTPKLLSVFETDSKTLLCRRERASKLLAVHGGVFFHGVAAVYRCVSIVRRSKHTETIVGLRDRLQDAVMLELRASKLLAVHGGVFTTA